MCHVLFNFMCHVFYHMVIVVTFICVTFFVWDLQEWKLQVFCVGVYKSGSYKFFCVGVIRVESKGLHYGAFIMKTKSLI